MHPHLEQDLGPPVILVECSLHLRGERQAHHEERFAAGERVPQSVN